MSSLSLAFHRLSSLPYFYGLAGKLLPWAGGLCIVLFGVGLYTGLALAPTDYEQGDGYRIIFVHVPAAWMSMFVYVVLAIAGTIALVWRLKLAEVVARASAPIGASYTFLALATGSIWGKPMWGTWWVWGARLTSVLVLFFLYLGYMALDNAFDDPGRGAKASSILALVGFVNVPIIKFSVDWWNTLHQPSSVVKMGGPAIHPSMLTPLLLMGLAFTTYYVWVLLIRIRREIIATKIRALQMRQAAGQGAAAPAAAPAPGEAR